MRTIRTNLTFTFDEARVGEQAIKDRLDAVLDQEFADVDDLHTRWVEKLSDSPLFGSTITTAARRRWTSKTADTEVGLIYFRANGYQCQRCGLQWIRGRTPTGKPSPHPTGCPKCKSRDWNLRLREQRRRA